MAINNVALSNTFADWVNVTNQLVVIGNQITEGQHITTGNITINPVNTAVVSLNVSNGIIRGNGAQLTSLGAANVVGTFRNSQLQNSSVTINTSGGLGGGGSVSLGGSLSLNVVPVDSTSNTRTDLPAAANAVNAAIKTLGNSAANASLITSGVLAVARGGTGQSTYANGEILIGNTLSDSLVKTTLTAGPGVIITNLQGAINVAANVSVTGSGLVATNGGAGEAIVIAANSASTTQPGVVQLNDTITSTSTTQAATANSVNAVHKQVIVANTTAVAANAAIVSKNTAGRLVGVSVHTANGVWTRPANTQYIVVEMTGGGAPGGGALAGSGDAAAGSGGGSAASLRTRIDSPNATENVIVGLRGVPNLSGGGVGSTGQPSSFSNVAAGNFCRVAGGAGGSTGTATSSTKTVGSSANTTAVLNTAGTVLMSTAGTRGGPGFTVENDIAIGGRGASTPFGAGGAQISANNAGLDASGYGAGGGGGACVGNPGSTQAAGNGSNGIVIVWSYADTT